MRENKIFFLSTSHSPKWNFMDRVFATNMQMINDPLSPSVTGLRLDRDLPEVDCQWIVYNRPAELTNKHAGFLFALGLTGWCSLSLVMVAISPLSR